VFPLIVSQTFVKLVKGELLPRAFSATGLIPMTSEEAVAAEKVAADKAAAVKLADAACA
jgi:hypothetical protein